MNRPVQLDVRTCIVSGHLPTQVDQERGEVDVTLHRDTVQPTAQSNHYFLVAPYVLSRHATYCVIRHTVPISM